MKSVFVSLKYKKVLPIVFILGLFCMMIGGTYAFMQFQETNRQIAGSSCFGINYTKGQDINGELYPGANYTTGYSTEVIFYSKATCNSNAIGKIYITTNNDSTMDLSDKALKYAVEVDGTIVSEGSVNGTTNQVIYNNFLLTKSSKPYKVYIWLDEALEDTSNLATESYSGFIHAEAIATSDVLTLGSAQNTLTHLQNLGFQGEVSNTNLTTFTTTSKLDGSTGIYAAEDDLGTSYYFRGNITNNYVKFGKNASGQDMYWRIIRINGDGSIRMIYDGTSPHANNEESEDRHIGTSAYNTNSADNSFVGYMNGTTDGTNFPSGGTSSTSYDEAHANITDSTIKTYVDAWYKTNIVDTGYSTSVVDAIYCNDRTRVTDPEKMAAIDSLFGLEATGEGYGQYVTYYSLFNRISSDFSSIVPTLKCSRTEDKFTVNEANGNGELTYPVGLLTLDELTYGGAFLELSEDYFNDETYLYNGTYWYWTMSPFVFYYGGAFVGETDLGAFLSNCVDDSYLGVRPVITLSSSAIKSGNGTASKPFSIEEEITYSPEEVLIKLGLTSSVKEDSQTTFTTTSKLDGTTGIYAAEDDLGTSYYFRGNITNNYVKFGKNASNQDMYWRIVRINGDGTVRMIYDGTQAYANNSATKDNIVGTSAYNTNYADNSFVGYMNGTTDGTNFPSGGTNSTSYNEAHTNRTNSTIKTYLDNWYKTNIVDTGYSTSVADAIYCNDRVPGTDETINGMLGATGEGFGQYITTYSLYNRISLSSEGMPESFSPTLLCEREEDKFTVSEELGNGDLTYPVGLITIDEMVYGGLYLYMDENSTNDESYLFEAGNDYWTMSPVVFVDSGALVNVGSDGAFFDGGNVEDSNGGVRPVITLSPSAITGGTGISTDPFTVSS